MNTDKFKVVFNGQLDGRPVSDIRAALEQLGFKATQVDNLLAGRPATIKRQLERVQAELYQRRLAGAGLLVDITPDPAPDMPAPLKLELVPVEEPAADEQEPAQAEPESSRPSAERPLRFEASEPGRSAPVETIQRRMAPVQFTGNGGEYFGIWIVNILLIIVTLGFYAPWAKVRNHQYFYGHTLIDDASFQYLADPWVIFRGRLIALVAVICWMLVANFFDYGELILLALFIPALPWIVIKSLKFAAVNSAYRGIRFDFKGGYGGACMILLVWPLVALLTLLLAAPLSLFKSQSFFVNNSFFGTTPFRLKASATDYYVFFLRVIAVAVGFFVLAAVLGKLVHPVLAVVLGALGYLALFGYFMAGLTNLVMNATVLGLHGFESRLGKRRMVWIFMTNSLLVVLTLGLYTPWAKVRMAAYQASCTSMAIYGDLDGFIAGETERTSAMGQEIGEAFDVGVSIV